VRKESRHIRKRTGEGEGGGIRARRLNQGLFSSWKRSHHDIRGVICFRRLYHIDISLFLPRSPMGRVRALTAPSLIARGNATLQAVRVVASRKSSRLLVSRMMMKKMTTTTTTWHGDIFCNEKLPRSSFGRLSDSMRRRLRHCDIAY